MRLSSFAGRRVIQDTIKQTLPEGFQTAEFALEHGLIDAIVERSDLKECLSRILALHSVPKEVELDQDMARVVPGGGVVRAMLRAAQDAVAARQDDKVEEGALSRLAGEVGKRINVRGSFSLKRALKKRGGSRCSFGYAPKEALFEGRQPGLGKRYDRSQHSSSNLQYLYQPYGRWVL